MELVKEQWTKEDIKEFQDYLKTFANPAKEEWSKNLLRTELPVLCMKTADIKEIIKQIYKGNYLSFLDLMIWEYYENTPINGYLISMIKDFDIQKKYLDIYSEKADNWATCDLLSFNTKGKEEQYLDLALIYTKNPKPFVKRIGLNILFHYLDTEEHLNIVFNVLESLNQEDHYYVNMMTAWLLSECFIKQRELTLKFLPHHKLNKFTINKVFKNPEIVVEYLMKTKNCYYNIKSNKNKC